MKRSVIAFCVFVALAASAAAAQEVRNEVNVQGTGFFTRNTDNGGVVRNHTYSAGLFAGYRFHINRWISAEAEYGFTRNSEIFSGVARGRIQSDVHAATGAAVINLPLGVGRFSPYVLAGGGSLTFRPTWRGGGSVPGSDTQTQGAFVYGVGTDYALSRQWSLRAEYHGLAYKAPDFSLLALDRDTWTHTAQPSAGIVFRF